MISNDWKGWHDQNRASQIACAWNDGILTWQRIAPRKRVVKGAAIASEIQQLVKVGYGGMGE